MNISQFIIWCAKPFASNELFALSNIHVICSALFKPFKHKELYYFSLCIWGFESMKGSNIVQAPIPGRQSIDY
jgi:hypothetical protein